MINNNAPDWTFHRNHLRDESLCVSDLLKVLQWDSARATRISNIAHDFISFIRNQKSSLGEIETMLNTYPLHTDEGMALMTLAESVLRIPDTETVDALISEKLSSGAWDKKTDGNWFTTSAGLGLSLAHKTLGSMLGSVGKPVIRASITEAIRRLGGQFVIGETIDDAIKAGRSYEQKKYRLSYDMLGEGARTYDDSRRYFESYKNAIQKIGTSLSGDDVLHRPCVSVKLSALHPRYTWSREKECVPHLVKDLFELCTMAKQYNIALTMDAEESDRLSLSLDIFAQVRAQPELNDWHGLGLAVQAYDKRAVLVIDDIVNLARATKHKIQIRLVKGAYWDSEIKKAQILGLENYPVFTRKENADLSYLACAQKLLAARDDVYPMFATHNAHSAAAVIDMAGNNKNGFEFQRLFGMGNALGDCLVTEYPVTIYAPVGPYPDLLPYLVRRMLENGASTSFVQNIRNENVNISELVTDVVQNIQSRKSHSHDQILIPRHIYGDARLNSKGFDVSDKNARQNLKYAGKIFDDVTPIVKGQNLKNGSPIITYAPFDRSQKISEVWESSPDHITTAFHVAQRGFEKWSQTPVTQRAKIIRDFADKLESSYPVWIARLQFEGGKTFNDAIAEVREAIDFCRYYAVQGEKDFTQDGVLLNGPTGENNSLTLNPRGVFVCISPWNFPLAIFVGQVVAALMAGNAVVCKPAEQTPGVAVHAVRDLITCGVPVEALSILIGDGKLGAMMISNSSVSGVAFTGSMEVARLINQNLAAKDGPIVPLIAETGGQNAMIVDSTALIEQTVDDVIASSFGSAGQRCSALRIVYVQKDIFENFEHVLKGAMAQLVIGNPCDWSIDIGPVIDKPAYDSLITHIDFLKSNARHIATTHLPDHNNGFFVAPCAFEISSIDILKRENFGPILHVIRFDIKDLERVLNEVNATGYGLTCGVQSRLNHRMRDISQRVSAGNIYINRTMTGAVVGVQPFGGQGLSGTGPKAGGPYYLHRFATEKVVSNNIAALGGNVSLLLLKDKTS